MEMLTRNNDRVPNPYTILINSNSISYYKNLIPLLPPTEKIDPQYNDFTQIENQQTSTNLDTDLIQLRSEELLADINNRYHGGSNPPLLFLLFLAAAGIFYFVGFWIALVFLIIGFLIIKAISDEESKKTTALYFVIDGEKEKLFKELVINGLGLSDSTRKWGLEKNKISELSISNSSQPYLLSNIEPLEFKYLDKAIYFFPDKILYYTPAEIKSFEYKNTEIDKQKVEETEIYNVPSDAEVINTYWEHEKIDGTRDMRYKNNRQYFVCEYDEIAFIFNDITRVTFRFSRSRIANNFIELFNKYKEVIPEEIIITTQSLEKEEQLDNEDQEPEGQSESTLINTHEFESSEWAGSKDLAEDRDTDHIVLTNSTIGVGRLIDNDSGEQIDPMAGFQAPINVKIENAEKNVSYENIEKHQPSYSKSVNIGIVCMVIIIFLSLIYFLIIKPESIQVVDPRKPDFNISKIYEEIVKDCGLDNDCYTNKCRASFTSDSDKSICITEVSNLLSDKIELNSSVSVQEHNSEQGGSKIVSESNQSGFNVGVENKEELLVFSNNFIKAINSRDLNRLMSFYNDFVQFHGNNFSVDEIKDDKKRYYDRWQIVNFTLNRDPEINRKGNVAEVTLPVKFLVESTNRNEAVSGTAIEKLIVSMIDKEWKIIAETETIIEYRTYSNKKATSSQINSVKRDSSNPEISQEVSTESNSEDTQSRNVDNLAGTTDEHDIYRPNPRNDSNTQFNTTVSTYINYLNGLDYTQRTAACNHYSESAGLNDFEKAAFKRACEVSGYSQSQIEPTPQPNYPPRQNEQQQVDVNSVLRIIEGVIRHVD